MKFIHLSDLHLGKRVNDFSMLEEQRAVLQQILAIIENEAPDGVLIAGDVYDRAVPPTEAVELFDDFLVALAERRVQVFVISGNHDSPERTAFGGRLMDASGIHLAPVYGGTVRPIPMRDAHGVLNVYLLPFLKPSNVRRFWGGEEIVTYTDALRTAIGAMDLDPAVRNLLVTHQFVTGSETCESEELSVGGSDQVDAAVFADFDYVALGHLHGAQNCGSERIRYSGTPLKYSFSEVHHEKSVTVVTFGKKGELEVRTVGLTPIHEMRELRGTFAELTDPVRVSAGPAAEDYLRITLTDEEDIPDAVGRLRRCYPNLMHIDYDNTRTRSTTAVTGGENVESKSALELFAELYLQQNNAPMSDEQNAYMKRIIDEIEETEQNGEGME